MSVYELRVPVRFFFIRVPYCFGDLKRVPNLEKYPYLCALHAERH